MNYKDVWKALMAADNSIPFVFMGRIAATIDHDMLKVIEISHLHRYREIRVEFAIMALCDECCSVETANKELVKLNPKYFFNGYPGCFFGNSISKDTCDIIVSDIILHIFPLFKQTTDAEKALSQLIRIDELREQNRLRWLDEMGLPDIRLKPVGFSTLWEGHYFYLAMKSHNYDFMCNSLKVRIEDYNERIQELNKQINEPQDNQDDKKFFEQRREELLDRVRMWDDYLYNAEIHNSDYFNKIIAENEQRTLQNLPKRLLKI